MNSKVGLLGAITAAVVLALIGFAVWKNDADERAPKPEPARFIPPPKPPDMSPMVFDGDLKGQLNRIAFEKKNSAEDDFYSAFTDSRMTRFNLKQLQKNPAKWAGLPALFSAKILEIREEEGTTFARVGEFPDDFFVVGRFETPFVEGNRVGIVGVFANNFEYQNALGGTRSIPAIAARHIVSMKDYEAIMRRVKKRDADRVKK